MFSELRRWIPLINLRAAEKKRQVELDHFNEIELLRDCVKLEMLPSNLIPAYGKEKNVLKLLNQEITRKKEILQSINTQQLYSKLKLHLGDNGYKLGILEKWWNKLGKKREAVKRCKDLFNNRFSVSNKAYVNLSGESLSKVQDTVLGLGPKFVFKKRFKEVDIRVMFEKVCNSVKKWEGGNCLKAKLMLEQKRQLQANRAIGVPKWFAEELRNLREKFVIVKADKENKLVVLKKEQYLALVNEIFSLRDIDGSLIFKKFVDKRVGKLGRNIYEKQGDLIYKFCSKVPGLSNKVRELDGGKQPFMFGLVKTHKEVKKVRPVISSVGSVGHALGKVLERFLSSRCKDKYTVKDGISFVKKLEELKLGNEDRLFSLDVESMYLNIPVERTLKMLVNEVFEDNEILMDGEMCWKKVDLMSALRLCCIKQKFNFEGNIYEQMNGVAMGSALGPLIASYYLGKCEEEVLDTKKVLLGKRNANGDSLSGKVKLYCRYVDDIFVIGSLENMEGIRSRLERKSGLRLTVEEELDGLINYIGITVRRVGLELETGIYHRFEPILSNIRSFIGKEHKYAGFRSLVERAVKLTSEVGSLDKELKLLSSVANDSGLEKGVCEEIIRKVKNKSIKVTGVNEDKIAKKYLVFPFINSDSNSRIKNIFSSKREVVPIFKANANLGLGLRVREPCVEGVDGLSNVIYKYSCQQCAATYVGQTGRPLRQRVVEHCRVDSLLSVAHRRSCVGEVRKEGFVVLDRSSNTYERLIKEAVYISREKPSLNIQVGCKAVSLNLI